jgi:L-lysine exporter family protein LysE/ArgO
MSGALLAGFALGASLIIAIGAQNAFVLRQGLKREHVLVLCLICSVSDAVLIAAGVAGLGSLIRQAPVLINWVSGAGAAFLAYYGAVALKRMLSPAAMAAAGGEAMPLKTAMTTCLALTFLNPHVYLDTVVLLGGLSARYAGAARLAYGIGAAAASFAWFFALGFGARFLAPVFARPLAWRVLDGLIAMVMWGLAARLVFEMRASGG